MSEPKDISRKHSRLTEEEIREWRQWRDKHDSSRSCYRCRWFEEWDPPLWEAHESTATGEVIWSVSHQGECRRRCPQIVFIEEFDEDPLTGHWPTVQSHDWCGEHDPRTGQ